MKSKLVLIHCICLLLAVMTGAGGYNTVRADDATNCANEAGGIWLYAIGPYTWTFDIVNSSQYDLTIVGVPNPVLFYPNAVVPAYRSMKYQYHVDAGAKRWQGDLAIKPGVGGSTYQFNVAFQESKGLNGIYPSTWINLPVPASGPYVKKNDWVDGRWSTNFPIGGDHKMHNMMTIISDKVIASLFTVDNQHVVLVVSDTFTNYGGTQLDWVFNYERGLVSSTTCSFPCNPNGPHGTNCQ